MLLLSVAEYVVRRELANDNAFIIGPGKVKMTRPSLLAIYRVFYSVGTVAVTLGKECRRVFRKALVPNVRTVMGLSGHSREHLRQGNLIL